MIYLDNSAGTRPYPEVIETITDILTNHWGNASADSSFGKDAMVIIDSVTNQVAEDINCNPEDIIWTSGACEANSLAIYGLVQNKHLHVLTSKLEHTSINLALNQLDRYECSYDFIANDCNGFIDLIDLENQLSHIIDNWHVPLVSISFANSEIGVIQDVKSIAEIVHKYNGILHVDATQMYPWYKINVKELGVDLMSVSGQKMNCCKGIGFLFVKSGVQIGPIIYGSQQDERRGGTYPTHLIAAFGKALELTRKYNNLGGVKDLRDYLLNKLLMIDGARLNGPSINNMRLPNNISLTIDGVKAETLTTMCDLMGVIIAKGSACKSHEPKPSETLLAIGLSKEKAINTIRISLNSFNSLEEIDKAADIITKLVERIRDEE
jgi:cysteine desulfurase